MQLQKKTQMHKLPGKQVSCHSRNTGNQREVVEMNLKLLGVVIPRP